MEAIDGENNDRPLQPLEPSDGGVEDIIGRPEVLPVAGLIVTEFNMHRVAMRRGQQHHELGQLSAVLPRTHWFVISKHQKSEIR